MKTLPLMAEQPRPLQVLFVIVLPIAFGAVTRLLPRRLGGDLPGALRCSAF